MHVSTCASTLERTLLDEWNSTVASTVHLFGELGEHTCDEIIDLIRRPQPAEDRDRVLLVLLGLERTGDTLAGKVLLKSFLPLAFRLAKTSKSTRALWRYSTTDATATTIGALWEVIHTYPMHRTYSVAGNIHLEFIKLLERSLGAHVDTEFCIGDQLVEDLANEDADHGADDTFRDLVTLFTWAIGHGTLTREEVRLLARVELAEGNTGEERELAAAELGITRETLNRRVQRIRTKLMHAVSGDVQQRVSYTPRRRG